MNPEVVEPLAEVSLELCLHFQTVGHDAVKGPQDAVEAGKDAQVLLGIVKVFVGKDPWCHVLILDSLIGDQGRIGAGMQVQCLVAVVVQLGELVVAGQKLFQVLVGEGF